ncbi:MAG: prephenate dehydrogenase/arogenate dehydrogenase family protein [Thermoplasmata archaeon]|nr:prephenate dehydrogenase/arogenate dehydrogenase family protein [Thermoplasmata archaeon]
MAPVEIQRLRRRLAQVDGDLQGAIGRRLELARSIGVEKRRRGLPVRDLEVERTVLARWRSGLERHGVPPRRAERLAQWLVDESVRTQQSHAPRPRQRRAPRSVVIVGGAGAMGRWFARSLLAVGHTVTIVDPLASSTPLPPGAVTSSDLLRSTAGADVVIIATPIRRAAPVYASLVEHRVPAVILDLLSVKAPIRPWIRRATARGLRVTSLHPMFGPATFDASGRVVLLMDCGVPSANRAARALLAGIGVKLVPMDLDQHDRWMAELQVLPRLAGLGFLGSLVGGVGATPRRNLLAPPSFRRQADVTRTSLEENPELSWDLISLNPHSPRVARRFAQAARELRELIARNDSARYRTHLERGRVAMGHLARSPSGNSPVPTATSSRRRSPRRGRRRRAAGGARTPGASRPTSRGGSRA